MNLSSCKCGKLSARANSKVMESRVSGVQYPNSTWVHEQPDIPPGIRYRRRRCQCNCEYYTLELNLEVLQYLANVANERLYYFLDALARASENIP